MKKGMKMPKAGPIKTDAVCDKMDFASREAYNRLRTKTYSFSFSADEAGRPCYRRDQFYSRRRQELYSY